MKDLAKHIEVLLLESNCVIVPGLGGFIAHYQPARFDEEKRQWVSPMRTFGFNPQLTINDGILAQSYMQAYNTDFPDATRMIEKAVAELSEKLYEGGSIYLNGIGKLFYTIDNHYGFEPEVSSTPYLYGLDAVKLTPLSAPQTVRQEPERKPTVIMVSPDENTAEGKHSLRKWWGNMVAAAAAVLLFFALSSPVENTYIDETNYASLGTSGLFEAIRNQSFATTVQQQQNVHKARIRNNVNTLKPVAVKVEKVTKTEQPEVAPKETAATATTETVKEPAPALKAAKAETAPKEAPKPSPAAVKTPAASASYYVIVSSVSTAADAESGAKALQGKGYAQAQAVNSGNKHRIALYRFTDKETAQRKTNELRKSNEFKNAWVLSSK